MKSLQESFSALQPRYRDAIEAEVNHIFEDASNDVTYISFTDDVWTHLIDDNVHTSLRRIDNMGNYHYERRIFDQVDDFDQGLEEFDLSGLYEIYLALEEKRYKLE